MQFPLLAGLLAALLAGQVAFAHDPPGDTKSNLTFLGAPRFSYEGPPQLMAVGSSYIQGQSNASTDINADDAQCGPNKECQDKSCCNSNGRCGYRDEHCSPPAPAKCLSNCGAKAVCGEDSKDGKVTCPLNLCCSYYGWCGQSEWFCRDKDENGNNTPCQKSFGRCDIPKSPTCGRDSGTASNGRKVAYYQGWNMRVRKCDRVPPSAIKTKDFTHLNFAFASIDPKTFQIVPQHEDDKKLYREFTDLQKPGGLQTWIAVGGWEFSDPGSTRNTWSMLASSKENRAAFIASVIKFMDEYKFQGLDLDWEYPALPDRGSTSDKDTINQVYLTEELRKAFGTKYGLSVVLAANYGYLKGQDPKGMEAQVDWFNVMSYDLHGPWDKTAGGKIKAHTDLMEIDDNIVPLWFNGVNPKKLNLGVAYYGRGYTADPKCLHYGCDFYAASKNGSCTNNAGVMSLCEISRLIDEKNLKPRLLTEGGAAVKEITWDDQWLSYDDDETVGMKTQYANNRCLGGISIWAIDYLSCDQSGGKPAQSNSGSLPSTTSLCVLPISQISDGQIQAPTGDCSPSASGKASGSSITASAGKSDVQSNSQPAQTNPQPTGQPGSSSSGQPSASSAPSGAPSNSAGKQSSAEPTGSDLPGVSSSGVGSSNSPVTQSSVKTTGSDRPSGSSSGVGPSGTAPAQTSGSNTFSNSASISTAQSPTGLPPTVTSSRGSMGPSSAQSGSQSSAGPRSSQVSPGPSSGATATTSPGGSMPLATTSFSHVLPWQCTMPWCSVFRTRPLTIGIPSQCSESWCWWLPQPTPTDWPECKHSDALSCLFPSGRPTPTGPITAAPQVTLPTECEIFKLDWCLKYRKIPLTRAPPECGWLNPPWPLWCLRWPGVTLPTSTSGSGPASSAIPGSGSSVGTVPTSSKPADSRSSTGPITSAAAVKTYKVPKECTYSWCPQYSTKHVTEPPSECRQFFKDDWPDFCQNWCDISDCTDENDEPDDKNNDSNDPCKGKKKRLFGCGCGWMGLPFGPGCSGDKLKIPDIEWDFPGFKYPEGGCGLFGCDMGCGWFGCNGGCGLLGCNGLCFPPGCNVKCPLELCKGPCPGGNCGPKPGGAPDRPSSQPKSCGRQDRTTVTHAWVSCKDYTTNGGSTVSSSCTELWKATLKGCKGITGTTTTTRKKDGGTCTRAALSLDEDEGDNEGVPDIITPPAPSTTTSGIPLPGSSSVQVKPTTTQAPTSTQAPPPPPPSSKDISGVWEIELHQWMERDKSEVWWKLVDSNGFEAGTGAGSTIKSQNRPKEHSLPWEITLNVEDATNIYGTNLRFLYEQSEGGCKIWWTSGQSKDDGQRGAQELCTDKKRGLPSGLDKNDLRCDEVWKVEWVKKNAGYERWFKCYFREPPGWPGSHKQEPFPRPGPPPPVPIRKSNTISGQWYMAIDSSIDVDSKFSEAQWTLYDSNGYEAGKGQGSPIKSQNRPKEHSLPGQIDIRIKEPLNPELLDVTFEYKQEVDHCKILWTTDPASWVGKFKPRIDLCNEKTRKRSSGLTLDQVGCSKESVYGWIETKRVEKAYTRRLWCKFHVPPLWANDPI